MPDIFISYPRLERERAERIRRALSDLGLSVFFDIDSIDGGKVFPDVITRALDSSKAVIACCSPLYFSRDWCLIEAREGKHRDIIVPLVTERFERHVPPADLRHLNYLDLTDWSGDIAHEDWSRTLQILGKLLGRDLTPKQGEPNQTALRPIVVVDAFGAGDTTNFAEAVDMVQEGGRIEVRPGRYGLSEPLEVSRSVTIAGTGAREKTVIFRTEQQSSECVTVILNCKTATIRNLSIQGTSGIAIYVGSGACTIEDCYLEAPETCLMLCQSAQGNIQRNTFENLCNRGSGTYGIEVQAGAFATITSNRFQSKETDGAVGVLIRRDGEAELRENTIEKLTIGILVCGRASIKKNEFIRCAGGSVEIGEGAFGLLEENTLLGDAELRDEDEDVGFDDDGIPYDADRTGFGIKVEKSASAIIRKNNITGAKYFGVHAEQCDAIEIHSNVIKTTGGAAIYVFLCKSPNIDSNIIDAARVGIYTRGSVPKIKGNECFNTGKFGIYHNHGGEGECAISDNIVSGRPRIGISAKNSKAIISGNTVGPSSYCGILAESYDDPIIVSSNRIEGSDEIGILAEGRNISVIGNIVQNAQQTGVVMHVISGGRAERNEMTDCGTAMKVAWGAPITDNFEVVQGRRHLLKREAD